MSDLRRGSSVVLALALACSGSSTPPPQRGSGERGQGRETDKADPEQPNPTAVDGDETKPTVSPSLADATKGLSPERAALAQTAATIVDDIRELEVARDVTCWTSFRQLDSFIASKSYSNFATLTKIVAAKALVHGVWIAASEKASGAELGKAEITAIFDPDTAAASASAKALPDDLALELGVQQFKDYRTTSEHWRLLLSIAQDELARKDPRVKPLAYDGAETLALVATRLSLALLTESGEVATEARSPLIEADHVKIAFTNLKGKWKIADIPTDDDSLDLAAAKPALVALTGRLIDAKIEALRRFNKAGDDIGKELGKISKIPVADSGAGALRAKLVRYGEFLARGYEPMRADNYLHRGDFAPGELVARGYIDPAYVENATVQLFPYVMMPNGDVRLRFVARPGDIHTTPLEPQDVLILDHQMNAVRDTAMHWVVLDDIWKAQPFAMDPFAGEYLSELLSIVATYWMRRAQTVARAGEASAIDDGIVGQIDEGGYVMVVPTDDAAVAAAWTPARQKAKDKALKPYRAALFSDASAAWGLPTTLAEPTGAVDPGSGGFDIQSVMGSGVAIGDVDGDGDRDMFLAGEGLGRLYLNQIAAGTRGFVDASEAWGVPKEMADSHHALFVDFDGDDDLDLLVVRGRDPSLLLENKDGKLTDVAAKRGLVTGRGAHVASAFDYDGDLDLDLYVGYYGSAACNKGECAGRNLPSVDGRNGTPNQLFRNDGERFVEVGAEAGCADEGWTLASGTFDLEGDGDLDLYLANDFGANPLFRNEGNGKFVDVAPELGANDRGSGMNVSFADLDGNGSFDLFVSNIDMFSKTIKIIFPQDESVVNLTDGILRSFQYLSGNKLYFNVADKDGRRRFEAREQQWFEPGDRGWGWAGVFFDVDADGDEDIYLANGWIPRSPAADQRNQMFVQDKGTFWMTPQDAPEAFPGNSRAVSPFDMDDDGDVDLAVNNYGQPPKLLENVVAPRGQMLRLRLDGAAPNTRAIGAQISVQAGRATMRRQITAGIGYLGQDDEVVHVGLGKARQATVMVRWPDGTTSTHGRLAAGPIHVLVPKPVAAP